MKRIVFALFLLVSVVRFIFAEQNEFVLDNFKYKIVDGQVNVCGPTNQNIFELHIPNDIDGQVVAIIEENAFKDCINLTNVVLPNRLMQIKNRAFYNCRMLKKINIPDNVIYIGYGAFGNCYSLQNVKLPKMLGSIGMELFRNCRSLTKCEIPEGVVSISDYAFAGCKNLDVIVLPRSLMECSKNAFIDTNVRLETTNICWQNREYDYSAMIQVNTQNVTVCGSGDIGVFVNGSNNVLPPFQIGKFPVTEDFYNSIMGIEINSTNLDLSNDDEILQYRPVKDMSFYKAIAFCNKLSLKLGLLPVYQIEGFDYDDWADFSADDIPTEYDCKWNNATCDYTCDGYRLPNEAELEFAFRGANQNDKNWNCFAEVINTSGTQKIRQVGLGSHNKLGLHDYLGNVLQLCNDNFDEVKKGLYFNRHIHNESGTKVALGGSAAKKNSAL